MTRIAQEPQAHRRGAAIVESAIVLSVLLFVLLGSLDLSLAVFRQNTLSESARRLARAAIVRGERSSAFQPAWGPDTYDGDAADGTDYARAIEAILIAVDPAEVRMRLEWPDGSNQTGDPVRASVSSEYEPIIASLFGADPYLLQATSIMSIEH